MINKKVTNRLLQLDWFVKCETEHELALVLNACFDADIRWFSEKSAINVSWNMDLPILIGRASEHWNKNLWQCTDLYDHDLDDIPDITDWFFEELRNEYEHNTD